jgi:DNA polymerase I-like protein with 3'-5' exonuclease and polymerase domains
MAWVKINYSAELGISKDKSDALFRQYHAKVPFVKQLMDNVSHRAQDSGKIRTLLGRLCRFHLWEPNQFGIHKSLPHDQALLEHGPGIKRAFTYKALNKLIQGSAADMTKKAMLELYKEGKYRIYKYMMNLTYLLKIKNMQIKLFK